MRVEEGARRTLGVTALAERRELKGHLPPPHPSPQALPPQVPPRPQAPPPESRPRRRLWGPLMQARQPRSWVRYRLLSLHALSARRQSRRPTRVLPAARTHSMTIRCFVSQPFSMENQGDRTMIAIGSFEEWDAFREA